VRKIAARLVLIRARISRRFEKAPREAQAEIEWDPVQRLLVVTQLTRVPDELRLGSIGSESLLAVASRGFALISQVGSL
jgi:hypothetical protein